MRHKIAALRIFLCFIVLFQAVWVMPATTDAASYYHLPPKPEGNIGVTKPIISKKFSFEGLEVANYTMYINNESVQVNYDRDKKTFQYIPDKDLSPGDYEVKLVFEFSGYSKQPIEYTWKFKVMSDAISQFSNITHEQQIALDAVNQYRIQLGLNPVTLNERLNASATAHARYQDVNDQITHYEEKGKSGFIGETLLERTTYFGYVSDIVMEDISQQTNDSPVDAVDGLFDAPYHRSPFLYPEVKEIGYGRVGKYHVINFGASTLPQTGEPQVVISPVENDTFVPPSWDGHEIPDPLRIHQNAEYPTGYPIMVGVYGGKVSKTAVLMVEMKDDQGTLYPHPIYWNGAGNKNKDDELQNEVILIPSKPLDYGKTYHIRTQILATFEDGSTKTIEKKWKFTTEHREGLGKKLLHVNDGATIATPNHAVIFGLDDANFSIDGRSFPVLVKPLVIEGFSYLAIRDLERALDAKVEWDETRNAAIYRKGDRTVVFDTDDGQVEVDGKLIKTNTPAKLISYDNESRTMVPVRLLSESLGCNVEYIAESRTVLIVYQ